MMGIKDECFEVFSIFCSNLHSIVSYATPIIDSLQIFKNLNGGYNTLNKRESSHHYIDYQNTLTTERGTMSNYPIWLSFHGSVHSIYKGMQFR